MRQILDFLRHKPRKKYKLLILNADKDPYSYLLILPERHGGEIVSTLRQSDLSTNRKQSFHRENMWKKKHIQSFTYIPVLSIPKQ